MGQGADPAVPRCFVFLCVMLVKTSANLSQKWVTSLTQLGRILGRLVPDLCGRPLGGDVHWFHVTQPG